MFQPAYDRVLEDIIIYVYRTEITSPLAYKRARIALLDSLGCAIETLSHSSEARAFIGTTVPGTVVPNGFRLPGTTYSLDPIKGAFDLGALIRYLDHNDAYPGAEWGHPSDNIGAIIAVADWISRSYKDSPHGRTITLKEILTAQIKAYEIQGVLQINNAFNKYGLDHTILVKVASTAVVAHLMGLDENQAICALSHAWQDGHPLRTFRQSPNAGPRKGWAAGDACSRAVHLCFLAQAGQSGAPSVLTAPKWGFQDALFGGHEIQVPRPYGTYVMEGHFFKLVAAEGHAISAAEAAVKVAAILKEVGRTPCDISKITIRTLQPAKIIIDKTGPLSNPADRDHCLQYIIAVSIFKQAFVEAEDYENDSQWAVSPEIDELRAKMIVLEDEQFTRDYRNPAVRSGTNALQVEMKTGEEIPEVIVQFPIGHPKHAETLDLVKKKFMANMAKGEFDSVAIEGMLKTVESDDVPIHNFIDLFAKEVYYKGRHGFPGK